MEERLSLSVALPLKRFTYVVFLCLLTAAGGWAQFMPTGTIIGTVKDPSGAVVPGATITITNTQTGVSNSTTSNDTGYYQFPSVQPGTYALAVSRAGFKKFTEKCSVQATSSTTADVTLQVGSATQTVTVSGQPPSLNTRSGSLGTVVPTRLIQNLPLSGRDPLMLIYLTPGVNWSFPNAGHYGGLCAQTGCNGVGYFSANGGWAPGNGVWLDGSSVNRSDTTQYFPNPDAIQELSVITNGYDAKYGDSGGAAVVMVTKSGTNHFHGDAYEYLQNSALNAAGFFTNLKGQKKPVSRYNDFGGSLGGPIIHNKAFFFVNYEGTRTSSSSTGIATVPTMAQRNGDFSSTFDKTGQLIKIYNPFSTRPDPNNSGQYIRDQFSGNIIPTKMINATSKAALAEVPMPNATGLPFTGVDNYVNTVTTAYPFNSYTGKFNYTLNQKNSFFVRYSDERYVPKSTAFFPAIAPGYTNNGDLNAEFGWTTTPTPSTVINANVALNHNWEDGVTPSYDVSSLGFASNIVNAIPFFPPFNVSDMSGFGNGRGSITHQYTWSTNFDMGYSRGKQNMTWGFQTVIKQLNNGNPTSQPSFNFNRGMTQGPSPANVGPDSGYGVASLLLGTMSNSGYDSSIDTYAITTPYVGAYFQDDIRLTPKLTITPGFRWEVWMPPTERHNHQQAGFDFTTANPIQSQAQANYAAIYPTLNPALQVLPPSQFKVLGGYLFATPANRREGRTYWPSFDPRFGFAYRLRPNTVIRGGYGFFREMWWWLYTRTNGFSNNTPIVGSVDGITPLNLVNNPIPGGLLPITGSSQGLATLLGTGASFINQNSEPVYYARWNIGIQHAFTKNLTLGVEFVSSTGYHLPVGSSGQTFTPAQPAEQDRQMVYLPPQYLSLGQQLFTQIPNPFYGLVPSSTAVGGPTIPLSQLLVTFPEFTGIDNARQTEGKSYYDGLQVTVTKRYSYGLSLLASYTFSKSLEATRYINSSDSGPTKQIGAYDAPQRFSLGGTYALPFGPGRPFGWKSGLGGRLIGGWHTAFNYQFQSGFNMFLNAPLVWTGVNPTLPASKRNEYDWFNLAAFVPQKSFTLRTTPWTLPFLRADALNNLDFSLIRDIKLREKLDLQFRLDTFNTLNAVQFGNPDVNPSDPAYGTISSQANSPRSMQLAVRLMF